MSQCPVGWSGFTVYVPKVKVSVRDDRGVNLPTQRGTYTIQLDLLCLEPQRNYQQLHFSPPPLILPCVGLFIVS